MQSRIKDTDNAKTVTGVFGLNDQPVESTFVS